TNQFQQALSYLDAHGFRLVMDSLNSVIVAESTVAQATSSLGLRFDVYSNGSSRYYTAYGASPLAGDYVYSSNVIALLLQHPTSLLIVSSSSRLSLRSGATSISNETATI